MSDELVRRLWKGIADTDAQQDAADRIAALEAALAKADALALAVADNAWRTDYEKNTLAAHLEARKLDA